MASQRAHDVVQGLTDEHDVGPAVHNVLNLPHTTFFKLRLQLVLEVLLAQQIKTVAGHSAKNDMDHSCGEFAIRGIEKRTQEGHQEDEPASPKTFRERLGIPGEEGYRTNHGQIEQAALDSPVNSRSRTGIVIGRVQDCVLPL